MVILVIFMVVLCWLSVCRLYMMVVLGFLLML